MSPNSDPDRWWHGGVFYQIYPRSYADSNGDGVGDLRRHRLQARPPGRPRHQRRVAVAGDLLAQPGLGLRRLRLLRHRPRLRDARRPRRARAGGGRAGNPDPHGSRAQPHERPAPVVRRRAERPRRGAPRLLRVGRPQARRKPAQQLDEHLRRLRLGARPGERAVLPAQLRGGPAGPRLVERGRAARVRRDRALLVGPRRGGIPDRRVQHDDQGQGAPRQPAGHRGRPARPAVHGGAGRLQHRPPRGPRHPAPLARHRGRLRARTPADR